VVRMSVLAGGLSLSCARLMDGCLTTLWVRRRYQSTNKANSACHPSGIS